MAARPLSCPVPSNVPGVSLLYDPAIGALRPTTDPFALARARRPAARGPLVTGGMAAHIETFLLEGPHPVELVFLNGRFLRRFSHGESLLGATHPAVLFSEARKMAEALGDKPVFFDEVRFSLFHLKGPALRSADCLALSRNALATAKGETVFAGLTLPGIQEWAAWLAALPGTLSDNLEAAP